MSKHRHHYHHHDKFDVDIIRRPSRENKRSMISGDKFPNPQAVATMNDIPLEALFNFDDLRVEEEEC